MIVVGVNDNILELLLLLLLLVTAATAHDELLICWCGLSGGWLFVLCFRVFEAAESFSGFFRVRGR